MILQTSQYLLIINNWKRILIMHLRYLDVKTVNNWYADIRRIESRLAIFPKSFTPESLLKNRDEDYRGTILMKNFKLIHYYDEAKDVVYIDAIWDMRMHTTKLKL